MVSLMRLLNYCGFASPVPDTCIIDECKFTTLTSVSDILGLGPPGQIVVTLLVEYRLSEDTEIEREN